MNLLEVVLWVFGAFTANIVLGAVVLASIDRDERLHRWVETCPREIAGLARPMVVILWPLTVWFYYRR